MTKELKEKIDLIWNKKSRRYNNHTFTLEEKNYMKEPSKFIWDFYNNDSLCSCGNKKRFISLNKGYNKTCKECSKLNRIKKTQQTMLEKYGYVSVFQDKTIHNKVIKKAQSKESRKKAQDTMISNNTHQSSINNIEKSKKTKLEKYGDKNYNNKEKIHNTMMEKYGVSSYAQLDSFKKDFSGNKNSSRKHFNNLNNFNETFIIKHFVLNKNFDIYTACEYFNCTYNAFKNMSFYASSVSRIGRQVSDNMKALFKDLFIYDNRKIIKPYELDMYSEEYNFAIEYNGLYWHSNKFKNKNYHLIKTEACEEKRIQLFHIFENEWLDKNKKSIWVSMIEDKLSKNKKIGARKCSIKEVPTKEARKFIDDNHMQGYCNSSIKIGMYHEDNLMSIMTFGKPRFNKNIDYELIRFCTKKGYTIQGGGSRMLKYFEKTYKPKSLLSYANRRWSTGNFYIKSGFTFKYNTTPNYFYFHPKENILWSRNKFQKHKLKGLLETFNPDVTEAENMHNNGYRKIYDSGNKVYVKEYK